MQAGLPSCVKSCKLESQFFGEPSEDDCDKVRDDWKDECDKRANGELEYRETTKEELKQLQMNRKHIIKCRRALM